MHARILHYTADLTMACARKNLNYDTWRTPYNMMLRPLDAPSFREDSGSEYRTADLF